VWLNYEVALFIYQPEFTGALRTLQQSYIAQSVRLESALWADRWRYRAASVVSLKMTT
jgi:cardiolipin synthase